MKSRTGTTYTSDRRVSYLRTVGPVRSPAVRQLLADPALRCTEHGRELLRLLNSDAMNREQWTALFNNVPPHCRPAVATVAMEWASFWQSVVEDLRRSSSSAA
jgi:hypothetical protein